MVLHLLAGEMDGFGGEDFAAAFEYLHFALAARAFAAACARQEDVFVGERCEDGGTGLCLYFGLAVYCDFHLAALYEIVLGYEQDYNQQERDGKEDAHSGKERD